MWWIVSFPFWACVQLHLFCDNLSQNRCSCTHAQTKTPGKQHGTCLVIRNNDVVGNDDHCILVTDEHSNECVRCRCQSHHASVSSVPCFANRRPTSNVGRQNSRRIKNRPSFVLSLSITSITLAVSASILSNQHVHLWSAFLAVQLNDDCCWESKKKVEI